MTFTSYLAALEEELPVPYPVRREILDELGAHLEDTYQALLADGVEPPEAGDRAIATLAVDGEFVRAMRDVHQTAVQKALERLPRRVSLGIEYGAVACVAAVLIFSTLSKESMMLEFLLSGGFLMIPINLAGIAILVIGGERLFSLFIKKDHGRSNLDRGVLSLGFLAVACIATGVIGTLAGFYQAFSMADVIAARYDDVFPIYDVARIAMTTTIWGTTLALIAVSLRFVIQAKYARIARLRADA